VSIHYLLPFTGSRVAVVVVVVAATVVVGSVDNAFTEDVDDTVELVVVILVEDPVVDVVVVVETGEGLSSPLLSSIPNSQSK